MQARRAYHKLVLRLHPDKNPGDQVHQGRQWSRGRRGCWAKKAGCKKGTAACCQQVLWMLV